MKNIDSFQDRQKTANAARERMLARLASRPAADDPAVLARAAERRAIDEARAARRMERQEADAAQERQRIEAAAEHIAKSEADAKARRDARYAARKLRTGRAVG